MSDDDPIPVDADQPAELRRAGESIDCPTLREAVLAWRNLPFDLKSTTAIALTSTGAEYHAGEIERLSLVPRRPVRRTRELSRDR
jgi:hypothetical protein